MADTEYRSPGMLSFEEEAAILAEDEARELAEMEAAIAAIDEQWSRAVERAANPGALLNDLHASRDAPLLRLVGARAHWLRLAGVDPDGVNIPEKAVTGESKLPKRLRGHFRRGHHLGVALKAAVAAKRKRR